MYPSTKFQLIWRNLDSWTKFAQRVTAYCNSIWQCAPVPNLANLENFNFWDQICPKATLGQSIEQTEPEKLMLSKKYYDMPGFRWF